MIRAGRAEMARLVFLIDAVCANVHVSPVLQDCGSELVGFSSVPNFFE